MKEQQYEIDRLKYVTIYMYIFYSKIVKLASLEDTVTSLNEDKGELERNNALLDKEVESLREIKEQFTVV